MSNLETFHFVDGFRLHEYLCRVQSLLDNPVYNALITRDERFSNGTDEVRYFDEEVSPFAGFRDTYEKGFDDLHDLLPPGRKILYATPKLIQEPAGWTRLAQIKGIQFVFEAKTSAVDAHRLIPLQVENIPEMVSLAELTKPGPFGPRTIEFGHYYGIFEEQRLAAMTGQRLHVSGFSEISAVCTHPDHLGKGFAGVLLQHQLKLICDMGEKPFLHVREDNDRAIALYERLGFRKTGPMNFYFLKKV
jgi:ribosomal protein S18 acetylase RimI-like enzyme